MGYNITSGGRRAKEATIRDLNKAIESMNNAIFQLNRVKGLGAERYIKEVNERIDRYTKVKNNLSKL